MNFLPMCPAQEMHSSRKRNNFSIYGIFEQPNLVLSVCERKYNVAVALANSQYHHGEPWEV